MSLIKNVNSQCKLYIEENIERFKKSLMIKGRGIEISWVEVLKYFDWLEEWEKIEQFLNDNEFIKTYQKD